MTRKAAQGLLWGGAPEQPRAGGGVLQKRRVRASSCQEEDHHSVTACVCFPRRPKQTTPEGAFNSRSSSLTALEARRLKSRVGRACAPSEGCRGSFLSSEGCGVGLGVLPVSSSSWWAERL